MSPRPYRLGQREAAVAQTRDRVLDAARSLFAEAGFHGASLEEVARRADVARKTVYYQFGSKRGLLAAVVADLERRAELVPRIRGIVEEADAVQALPAYLREVCRFWAGAQDLLRPLHGLAALDREVAEVLAAHDAARRARLVGFVDRLAEQRGLPPGEPRQRAVEALWMLTSFATFDHLVGRGGLPIEAAAALLTDLAEGVLHAPGDRAARP
jgi:AcrR family transcriptional regulator